MLKYVYLFGNLAIVGIAQVLFKVLSSRITGIADIFRHRNHFLLFMAIAVMYAASVFLWISALRYFPLSVGYLYNALAFILVPLAAHYLLGETIGVYQLLGGGLIICGIVCANTASGS